MEDFNNNDEKTNLGPREYTYTIQNCDAYLKKILESWRLIEGETSDKLRINLNLISDKTWWTDVTRIFVLLNENKIIEDWNVLIELIEEKYFDFDDLTELINLLENKEITYSSKIKNIIRKNCCEFGLNRILRLVSISKICIEFAKGFADYYCERIIEEGNEKDYEKLMDRINEENQFELRKYLIDKSYQDIVKKENTPRAFLYELVKNSGGNNTKEYCELEMNLVEYVNHNGKVNGYILEDLIPLINSKRLLEAIVIRITQIGGYTNSIRYLLTNSIIGDLKDEVIESYTSTFIKIDPVSILKLILIANPKTYNDATDKIILNKVIFINFHKLLEEYGYIIKKLAKKFNDINKLTWFYFEPTDEENIRNVKCIIERDKCGFQTEFMKFYIYLFAKKQISELIIRRIILSFEIKELSGLFIKSFIESKVQSRDELMNLMNKILKEHFRFLLNREMEESEFDEIYSIRFLVKKCDGRKKYEGLTFWEKNGITRWYTYGHHNLTVGKKEDIYCEGRFWKRQPFYMADSNTSTKELYSFYWCKNVICSGVNDKVEFDKSFEEWTLLEINEIFKINLDRLAFTYLAGWLNRMLTIFDRLKCKDCNSYLRPLNYVPSMLGYYAVPIFTCLNEKCVQLNKQVRFTHCIGCGKILDSRDCKVCNKCHWLVCDDESCLKCGCGVEYNAVEVAY
ncbi:MAG: hypothetical protein WCQ95_03675 [Bacteroidota bacterium]